MTAPPPTIYLLNAAEIRQGVTDGHRLIASRQLETAAVLLWSAFEEAVRLFPDGLRAADRRSYLDQ